MANQPRVAKVLAALLLSMTAGAIVLMALGNNPPAAGPWSLWTYRSLDPIQQAVSSRAPQSPARWNCIEVYYSGTNGGDAKRLASLAGLPGPQGLDCHFVICNGTGGGDGHVDTTEKWQQQWSVIPSRTWYGTRQTIRICVVGDGIKVRPTDCQLRRSEALVAELHKRFRIPADSIYQPRNWP